VTYEELTPEQRAKVDAFRARHDTPEARAEEEALRAAIEAEFPPAVPDETLAAFLSDLRAERERQGLSLADMSKRTGGMDRATISRLENGRQPNPTWATLAALAEALGCRIEIKLVQPEPAAPTVR
jgi:DNA-binding XRE family transcriptional regulator